MLKVYFKKFQLNSNNAQGGACVGGSLWSFVHPKRRNTRRESLSVKSWSCIVTNNSSET